MAEGRRYRFPYFIGGPRHLEPISEDLWQQRMARFPAPEPAGPTPETVPPAITYRAVPMAFGSGRQIDLMVFDGITPSEAIALLVDYMLGCSVLYREAVMSDPVETLHAVEARVERLR